MKLLYDNAKATVRNGTEVGDWFHQEKGSRQGDPSSPYNIHHLFVTNHTVYNYADPWLEYSWSNV